MNDQTREERSSSEPGVLGEDGSAGCAFGHLEWGHWANPAERALLASASTPQEDARRARRIHREFQRGFRELRGLAPCVTVFGSARTQEADPHYALARSVGSALARAGFTVMTGGGPGIMEAANRGAREGGGVSAGCNIRLPSEQKPNSYLDRWLEVRYFFVRKVLLLKYSAAFIALPGGFGTLDEILETVTLVQTGKILDFPIFLMGEEHWRPLVAYFDERLLARGLISVADLRRLVLTDDVEAVVDCIRSCAARRFGLQSGVPRRAAAEPRCESQP
jgi:uncharacterized protein (TIGR00730 family)